MEQQDKWCWWCCHTFEGESIGFPYKYDELRDRFSTFGHFCSLSCVKAFNLDSDSATKGINAAWILMMKKRMYRSISPIRAAPKRWSLKEFGGPLSIEEFRRLDSSQVIVSMPNDVRRMPEIIAPPPQQQQQLSEELVLKRPKPLKKEQSLLEKSLGLTRKCQSGNSKVVQR